eukprot:4372996-Prymnesium_polylepis.1
MLSTHGIGPFTGENTLHVVAVNKHERFMLSMVDLACEHFDRQQLESFYWAQAVGGFFHDFPMRYYGGSPIGYMTAFSLARPIAVICHQSLQVEKMNGIVNMNAHSYACRITGFLPLHVAVVNGLTGMYDFLLNFPRLRALESLRADMQMVSTRRGMILDNAGLSSLQLAAKIGDHRMFQYITKKTARVQWVWGPVASYQLSLAGIDSLGVGNDVMD